VNTSLTAEDEALLDQVKANLLAEDGSAGLLGFPVNPDRKALILKCHDDSIQNRNCSFKGVAGDVQIIAMSQTVFVFKR
jgi:hypothetical protein